MYISVMPFYARSTDLRYRPIAPRYWTIACLRHRRLLAQQSTNDVHWQCCAICRWLRKRPIVLQRSAIDRYRKSFNSAQHRVQECARPDVRCDIVTSITDERKVNLSKRKVCNRQTDRQTNMTKISVYAGEM